MDAVAESPTPGWPRRTTLPGGRSPAMWDTPVSSPAALRALPLPTTPPPGTLDTVVGLLLARAAPFDASTQNLLRRQHGWVVTAPEPITDIRTHQRFTATTRLRQLTQATPPPPALIRAVQLLQELTPIPVADATAALRAAGLLDSPMHPAGVLSLAHLYRVATPLRVETTDVRPTLVGPTHPEAQAKLRSILGTVRAAGHANLISLLADDPVLVRAVEHQIGRTERVHRRGPVLLRVDDRSSGLATHVLRMLYAAPRPLTVAELHDGLDRAWRFRRQRRVSPALLQDWLTHQPWLTVGDATVAMAGPATVSQTRRAHAGGTHELAQQLRAGTATFAELLQPLREAGLGADAAKMVVHTHPILIHCALNSYALRGAN